MRQNEEALSWVSSFTNRGENIFLIVGYLFFADADATMNAQEVEASIQAMSLSYGNQRITNEKELSKKTPGDRIWAIGHRQIRFPLFGRRELSRAKLQPKTMWTVIAGGNRRGKINL